MSKGRLENTIEFDGGIFLPVETMMVYNDAVDHCTSIGGKLLSFNFPKTFELAKKLKKPWDDWHAGLSFKEGERKIWNDGYGLERIFVLLYFANSEIEDYGTAFLAQIGDGIKLVMFEQDTLGKFVCVMGPVPSSTTTSFTSTSPEMETNVLPLGLNIFILLGGLLVLCVLCYILYKGCKNLTSHAIIALYKKKP